MTDQLKAPPLPAEHRTRVLALLADVGVDVVDGSEYVAWNGVVRVKVERMNGSKWADTRSKLTRLMIERDMFYGISHSEFFIEDADELTFRPREAMR